MSRLVLAAYAVAVMVFVAATSRTRSSDAVDRQLERFGALLDAGRAVNSAHDLDHVLQTILDNAVRIVRGRTGSVMLCDGDELAVVAAIGNDRALGRRLGLGDGIAGRVAMTRSPLLIEGTASPTRYPGLATREAPVDTAMSVPMVDREELVGVLNVSAPPSGRFSDDDMQTLAAFAEQAAAAIAKARLYESSRRMSDDLAHRATHDSLTGLPNRALLRGRVAASLEREPVEGSLLFVDLDGFKRVNDRLGHAAGDYLLTLTAERMQGACPASALAARIGGDEFAVLVPDGAADEAAAVASSVIDAVGRPVLVDGTTVEVSASVGIALIGVHGSTYPDLMAAADAALYHAKRTGKNRYELADTTAAAASQLPRPRLTSEPGPRGEHVSG